MRKAIYRGQGENGFSIVEVMICVAIIGILAAVAIPQYQAQVVHAAETEGILMMDGLRKEMTIFYAFNDRFPSFDDLGWTTASAESPGGISFFAAVGLGDVQDTRETVRDAQESFEAAAEAGPPPGPSPYYCEVTTASGQTYNLMFCDSYGNCGDSVVFATSTGAIAFAATSGGRLGDTKRYFYAYVFPSSTESDAGIIPAAID